MSESTCFLSLTRDWLREPYREAPFLIPVHPLVPSRGSTGMLAGEAFARLAFIGTVKERRPVVATGNLAIDHTTPYYPDPRQAGTRHSLPSTIGSLPRGRIDPGACLGMPTGVSPYPHVSALKLPSSIPLEQPWERQDSDLQPYATFVHDAV